MWFNCGSAPSDPGSSVVLLQIFNERQEDLRRLSRPLSCTCFRTSIWDETLYKVIFITPGITAFSSSSPSLFTVIYTSSKFYTGLQTARSTNTQTRVERMLNQRHGRGVEKRSLYRPLRNLNDDSTSARYWIFSALCL